MGGRRHHPFTLALLSAARAAARRTRLPSAAIMTFLAEGMLLFHAPTCAAIED